MVAKDTQEHGSIFSISGPVVVAENMIGCAMYELVRSQRASPRQIAPECLTIEILTPRLL
jgi:vacuolar-type H+-ATPase catalytic subunit A/Vma1